MVRESNRIAKAIPTFLSLAMIFGILWLPGAASAASAGGSHVAGWTEYCPYFDTLKDDPILQHGQEGKAPASDFFGAMSVNASSTFGSLRAGTTTCLANPYDTSAYYAPTMYKSGQPVQAKTMFEYYWAPKGNSPDQVQAYPDGLTMYATADHIKWTCGGGGGVSSPMFGTKAPRKKYPFDCSPWPGSRVTAYIVLPNCLNTQSSDVTYPDPSTGCPAGDTVLPGLYLGENWYLANGTGVTFSTGDYTTFRGMFFEAWDHTEMVRLLGACMTNFKWCGAWTHSGQNYPPKIKSVQVIPTNVHDTDTPLAIPVNVHDPDGDPIVAYNYQWEVNQESVGPNSSTLDPNLFGPNDQLDVTITAEDDHGNWSLPVTSPVITVLYDVICPQPGKPGGLLQNVHGGGFGPSESVALRLDSPSGKLLATVQSDVVGAFSNVDVQLPQQISGGAHKLYGVGATSSIVGFGPFTINPVGDMNPTALAAGDSTTLTGTGFVPNETVTVAFPNNEPQSFQADGQGNLNANLTAPAEPGPNQYVTVTSSGDPVDVQYKVLSTLTIGPSGEPGVPMPFSLSGFGANENAELYVDDVDSGQGFMTDATGSVSSNVSVDATFGTHQLKFQGVQSAISASTHVAMPAYVNLTPSSGPVGTTVTVSSKYGWPANDTVSFYWDKQPQGQLTPDGNGSVQTMINVPAHNPGNVTIKLSDTKLGANPTATFTITTFGASGSAQGQNGPPSIGAVLIDGSPYTNTTFTGVAHDVKDPDGDPVTLHYTWKVNGRTVGGDTETYSSSSLKAGDVLDLWIRPEDNHGNWGQSVEANSTLTMKWEVSAADAQPSLTSHPVYLYNYAPNEPVDMRLDSPTGKTIDTIPVNDNGNAQRAQVQIPWPATGGAHVLYGVGEQSGIVGQGPITLHPIAYNVPGSLHVGDTDAISGSGYKPGEQVTASFPGGKGVTVNADSTGSISLNLVMPDEPYPGGDITVQAASGNTKAPFKVLSSMIFASNVAEPMDQVPFQVHGYGASEKVDESIDGVVMGSFTTKPDGSYSGMMTMAAMFGKHRIVLAGESSLQQHNVKMSLPPYMTVTPNPAHPGDILTIKSLYGWDPDPQNETVYLYWGRQVVQVLHPDIQGSIITTIQVPSTQKPGQVSLKMLDTYLAKVAKYTLTIVS